MYSLRSKPLNTNILINFIITTIEVTLILLYGRLKLTFK